MNRLYNYVFGDNVANYVINIPKNRSKLAFPKNRPKP